MQIDYAPSKPHGVTQLMHVGDIDIESEVAALVDVTGRAQAAKRIGYAGAAVWALGILTGNSAAKATGFGAALASYLIYKAE
jgi:hypothetical protein